MASEDKRSAQLTFDFGDMPEDAVTLPDEEMEEENTSSSILSENFLFPPSEDDDLMEDEEEDSSFSGSLPISGKEPEKEEEAAWEVVAEEEESSSIPAEEKTKERETFLPAPQEDADPIPEKKSSAPKMDSKLLKRAALAFLGSLNPSGLAMDVPTRYRKYIVDGAAYWAEADKKGIMQIVRTAIVETRLEKALCNECANPGDLINELSAARQEKSRLEAVIRETEPHLQDMDALFSEHSFWNYNKSRNQDYKEVLKKIHLLEHTLFHGSRFDKLRKAKVATEFYLLVPEGEVLPDAIAESWGLVALRKDLTFHLVKEPAMQECPESHYRHLALNIGRSALSNVLFAQGIHKDPATGALSLGKLPRKRRN